MYLSRAQLNPKRISSTDLSALHSWVEESFPEEIKKGEHSRKLWRIDTLQGKEYLLLVSQKPPAPKAFARYAVPHTCETRDYTPLLDSIKKGNQYYFHAVLTPNISRRTETGKRGKVVACTTEEEKYEYLLKRSAPNGFHIAPEQVQIIKEERLPFHKMKKNDYLNRVTYQGILEVIDVDLFIATLTQGIGRRKAFGFGLFTVLPIV